MKKLYFIFCLGVLMLSVQVEGFGQIVAWDFYQNVATAATFNSTYTDPNIEPASLVRGAGAPVAGGYTYGVSIRFNQNATDYTTAKANEAYMEFKVKVKSGFKVSLEGLDAKLRSTAEQNGAKYFSWAYWVKNASDANQDVLGANFVRIGNTDHPFPNFASGNDPAFPFPTIDLMDIAALQNVDEAKEIVFRIYGWGALGGSTNNTTAFGKSASSKGSISLMLRGVTSVDDIALTKNAPIAKWNFNSSSATDAPAISPMDAQFKRADLSVFNLKRGSGLEGAISQRAFVSKLSAVTTSLALAEQNNEYYEIELKTADVNNFMSLSSLMFRYIKEVGKGPSNYIWKYSVNGGTTFSDIGQAQTFSANIPDDGVDIYLDLQSIGELQNVKGQTVLLRMYTWGGSLGFFGFGKFNHSLTDFSSIIIKGKVDIVTPVKLTSFTGKKESNGVKLNWQTASEQNNSHFEVYKSATGKPGIFVGSTSGAGNSTTLNNYSLTDYEPFIGTTYYQLRQVDTDGKYQESKVISVKNTLEAVAGMKVYPGESSIHVNIQGVKKATGLLQVSDTNGRLVYKQEVTLVEGTNAFDLPFNAVRGVYILTLKANTNKQLATKFIW